VLHASSCTVTVKHDIKLKFKNLKNQPRDRHEPSLLHLQRLKSQHHEKSLSVGITLPFSDGLVALKGEAPPIHLSPLAPPDGIVYQQPLSRG